MRQHDVVGGVGNLGLSAAQPCPVRNREGRGKDRAAPLSGPFRPAKTRHNRASIGSAAGVVPQRSRPQRVALLVEHNQAVLLRAYRHGSDFFSQTRLGEGLGHGGLPRAGIGLTCSSLTSHLVAGHASSDHPPVVGIDDKHLRALGGTINPGDKRHTGSSLSSSHRPGAGDRVGDDRGHRDLAGYNVLQACPRGATALGP